MEEGASPEADFNILLHNSIPPPFSTPAWRQTQQEKREAVIRCSWSSNQKVSAEPSKIKPGLKSLSIFEAAQEEKQIGHTWQQTCNGGSEERLEC